MRLLRPIIVFVLFAVSLGACGGGSDQASTTSVQTETTSEGEGSQTASESTQDGGSVAGSNSAEYTVSGSYEASGEATLQPAMSFFDNGIWTMTFGDEAGSLLILSLDPATPSVNFTDGKFTVSGDTSNCEFNITRQDATGAAGSFDCSNAPGVSAASGALTQDNSISGSFDANP